jgi:hypothetical protein
MAERPPHPALGPSGSVGAQLDPLVAEIDCVETEIAPQGRERLALTQRGRTKSRTVPSTAKSRKPLNSTDLASSPRDDGSNLAFADGWMHKNRQDGLPSFEHRAERIQRYYSVDLAEGW